MRPLRDINKSTQKYWSLVNIKDGVDDCWEWGGSTDDKTGYGYSYGVNPYDKRTTAHRVGWNIMFGEIPDGLEVGHKCGNKICVNPTHLYLTDRLENNREASYRDNYLYPNTIGEAELQKCIIKAKADQCRHALRGVDYTEIEDNLAVDIYNMLGSGKKVLPSTGEDKDKIIDSIITHCGHPKSYIVSSGGGTNYCLMCEYNAQAEVIRKFRRLYDDCENVITRY